MKRELGTLERALMIADQHTPFHMVSVLQIENAPPPHVLKQALQILQNRHPFLRARLLHEKGTYYFARLVEPSLPFYFLPRWNAQHWIYMAEVELGKRIDALSGPLFRCTYLHSAAEDRGDIIFSFYHPCVDASSVEQILHQLLVICASFMDEKTVSPYELAPAPPVESRFPPTFRGVLLAFHKLRYAVQQAIADMMFRQQTRDKRTAQVPPQAGPGHVLSMQLPADMTESLAQRARKAAVTLNSILHAVTLLAVNRHLYAGQPVPMRAFSFTSLRPYVEPPLREEDLACYVSPLRCVISVYGGADLWPLAREVHRKFDAPLKSGEKYVAAASAERQAIELTQSKLHRVSATALNYSGVIPVQALYGRMRVMGVHGFVSASDLGPELSVQARIYNNQLFCDFTYQEADMSREEASAIVDEIRSILNLALSNGEASQKTLPLNP